MFRWKGGIVPRITQEGYLAWQITIKTNQVRAAAARAAVHQADLPAAALRAADQAKVRSRAAAESLQEIGKVTKPDQAIPYRQSGVVKYSRRFLFLFEKSGSLGFALIEHKTFTRGLLKSFPIENSNFPS